MIDSILNDAKAPMDEDIIIPSNTQTENTEKVNTGNPVIEKENIITPLVKENVKTDTKELTSEKFLELNPINASTITSK